MSLHPYPAGVAPAMPSNNDQPAPLAHHTTTPTATSTPASTQRRHARDSPNDARRLRRVKDSREQLKSKSKPRQRAPSTATIDTTASVASATGRSYTVANLHNGLLYLRPIVRPGNQRHAPPQDAFVFPSPQHTPQTPPDSANLYASSDWQLHSARASTTPTTRPPPTPPLPQSLSSLPQSPTSPQSPRSPRSPQSPHNTRPPPTPPAPFASITQHATPRPNAHAHAHAHAHTRARSFSTADDLTVTSASNEPGTFKVVIERPPFGRPRTADTSSLSFPLLQVPIPTYHLGTPRFSTRGTLEMRSSVYTRTSATDDFRSSLLVTPSRPGAPSFLSSRLSSDAFSPVPARYRATMDRPPLPPSAPSSSRMSHAPISPRLYDALAANPDDSAVVRFSATGDIVAATPSRLVAHITSPSFLDYELLSDFFLTFRAFLSTRDLVAYLISRLQWAVDRQDDFGRIVRVRTFVALRHWILNYFVDDFVPVYALRAYFCTLVNTLYASLKVRVGGSAGDVKIVGELKKCWRRTCALYWETEDNSEKDFADELLLPGGSPELQMSFESVMAAAPVPVPMPTTPPRQTARDTQDTIGSNPSDQFASRHMDWTQKTRHTPQNSMSAPNGASYDGDMIRVPLSPASEQSMHVLSCSIPRRGLHKTEKSSNIAMKPHPVPHAAPPTAPPRLAASPQLSTAAKKSNRPSYTHKRSGSFSDALRDSRAPLSIPKNASVDMTISAITSMPGSLVRGGLFQPSSPYIELPNNDLRHTRSRSETDGEDFYTNELNMRQAHAATPGMKKIFGTMRRALSIKQQPGTSPQLGGPAHRRLASSIRSSNPVLSSSASGGVHKRRLMRTRPEVRVDLLASRVVESFRRAVEEQMRSEDQQRDGIETPGLCGFEFEFGSRKNSAVDDNAKMPDPRVQSEITTGSKSILIIDDTGPPPIPEFTATFPPAEAANPPPELHQRNISLDATLASEAVPEPPSLLQSHSQPSLQRPLAAQRSLSGAPERMHSFVRRGSLKRNSIARISLRRHASHNSLLSRQPKAESFATFQTMSSNNDPFFLDRHPVANESTPGRQLRRRPGGDLRAADNINDLEPIPRPHSTGSISTRTHSMANSIVLRSDRFIPGTPTSRATEVIDEPVVAKKPISLVATHSSQPNLRPSFEAEVAKLAALPDDLDDEGGIEATLLKLEGRYEKKSPSIPSARTSMQPEFYQPTGAPTEPVKLSYIPLDPEEHVQAEVSSYRPSTPPNAEEQEAYHPRQAGYVRREPGVDSFGESEDSYSSIPLLDRHLSDSVNLHQSPTLDTMRSSAKPLPLQYATDAIAQSKADSGSPASSLEYVVETESMKRIPNGGTLPRSPIARHSFLLDEDEDLSDMASTTTGARSEGTSHGVRSFFGDEPAAIENDMGKLPMHPMRHPPTPPQTANRLNDTLTETMVFDRGLPSPVLTPTVSRANPMSSRQAADKHPVPKSSGDKPSEPVVHMPFILAYDAEVLAQQFTVVEKDALDEIDWKELIELRWKQSSPQIRDWVHYLQTQEARGVDVVIARFNLVVKWVVSECLLTEGVEERARCIVQYIHIASHARRLRNYATMYQIAIALISNDISRLHKTWALVPVAERQVMRELEALVQPLKNFHNLRLEMETVTVEDGCIPFIGIYTRDLIYNAQKPAFIDAPPVDGERLVNFERHHTAATIVKNLLRLLEASSRYAFKVEPDLISKCLWLAAMGDDEIAARVRHCE